MSVSGLSALPGLPNEIIGELIGYIPDCVLPLRVVSRELKRNADEFLRWNAENIVKQCPRMSSLLPRLIEKRFAGLCREYGSDSDRIGYQFYKSLPSIIRAMGVSSQIPWYRFPSLAEIEQCNQKIEDDHLVKFWSTVIPCLLEDRAERGVPLPEELPDIEAPVQEIRAWMQSEANRALFQVITRVSFGVCHLKYIPQEIGLCAALQRLDLARNDLYFHTGGLFQELGALEWLSLEKNPLCFVPSGLFQGLGHLRTLNMQSAQLRSLPNGLFQGLGALEELTLDHNELGSVCEGLFQELGALERLSLAYNQLQSLPEGSFRGLGRLGKLSLQGNRLYSLPGQLFQGLDRLKILSLATNPLSSLPEEIFHGLTMLEELFLFGTGLVSLPQGIFRELRMLRVLDLGSNQLGSLPEGLFQGTPQLFLLGLDCNRALLIFSREDPLDHMGNAPTLIAKMDRFFNHNCISVFAKFYRLAAGSAPLDVLKTAFSELPHNIKMALFSKVARRGGHVDDPRWGREHLFDEMPRFNEALKDYVNEMTRSLGADGAGMHPLQIIDAVM